MSYSSITAELSPDDIALGDGRVEEAPQTTETSVEAPAEAPTDAAAKPPAVGWEQRRINALTRKLNEESRRRELAERNTAQVVEIARRAVAGEEQPQATPEGPTREEFDSAVAQAAAKQQFDAECTQIYNSGVDDLPGFEARLGNFRAIGGMSQPLIEAVMESSSSAVSPQKILFELGGNMDEAARIAELSPVKMAAAVAKFAAGIKEETRAMTRAPAPIKTLTPAAALVDKDPEKMDPKEWRIWREAQVAARVRR